MHINTALSNLALTTAVSREQLGLSIQALAELRRCGVSESTIRRIEKAAETGYNPSLATLVKLANGLRINLPDLINHIQNARHGRRGI